MITVAVPESITREAYVALIAGAGFDTNDPRKLEFRMDGIYAEVRARHPETGALMIDKYNDELVVNTVWIPVQD